MREVLKFHFFRAEEGAGNHCGNSQKQICEKCIFTSLFLFQVIYLGEKNSFTIISYVYREVLLRKDALTHSGDACSVHQWQVTTHMTTPAAQGGQRGSVTLL